MEKPEHRSSKKDKFKSEKSGSRLKVEDKKRSDVSAEKAPKIEKKKMKPEPKPEPKPKPEPEPEAEAEAEAESESEPAAEPAAELESSSLFVPEDDSNNEEELMDVEEMVSEYDPEFNQDPS